MTARTAPLGRFVEVAVRQAAREAIAADPAHGALVARLSALGEERWRLRRKVARLEAVLARMVGDSLAQWTVDSRARPRRAVDPYHRRADGTFQPGVSQPARSVTLPNSGSFAPGAVPANVRPLYAVRLDRNHVLIKVPEADPYRPGRETCWRRWARWVWEREHGRAVPAWHCIIQLDGDPWNCDPSNLELVDRGVHAQLCKQGFWRVALALRPLELARVRLAVLAARRRREELVT